MRGGWGWGWGWVILFFAFLIDIFDVWYSIALRACMVFGVCRLAKVFGDTGSFHTSRSFDFGRGRRQRGVKWERAGWFEGR